MTQPVVCSGKTLRMSADARGGSVRVTVLDADGKAAMVSEPTTDDVTNTPVKIRGRSDLSKVRGSRVRLKVELTQATLYAFAFGE